MDISIKEDNYKIMDVGLISWLTYIMVHSVWPGQVLTVITRGSIRE